MVFRGLAVVFCIIVYAVALSIRSPAELQRETFSIVLFFSCFWFFFLMLFCVISLAWVLASFSARLGSPGVVAPIGIPSDNLGCQAFSGADISQVTGKVRY